MSQNKPNEPDPKIPGDRSISGDAIVPPLQQEPKIPGVDRSLS